MTFRFCLLTVRLLAATGLLVSYHAALAQLTVGTDSLPTDIATDDIQQPIRIRADVEERVAVDGLPVRLMMGRVVLEQGNLSMTADKMAVVTVEQSSSFDVRVYAENVILKESDNPRSLAVHVLHLQSLRSPEVLSGNSRTVDVSHDPLLQRAGEVLFPGRFPSRQHVALQVTPDSFLPSLSGLDGNALPTTRRIQVRPRSSQPLRFESSQSTDTVPPEQIIVITGGANFLIEGLEHNFQGLLITPGVIDISADRIVAWMQAGENGRLDTGEPWIQSSDARLQLYLEGNIVIRHKQNTITATHAFYDASSDRALLLNAELRALLPASGGMVRVRAERMRQLSQDRFHAQNAWATTSPYGQPGYRLQATDIFVEPGAATPWTGTDPLTGQQVVNESTWITSLNNQLIIGETPVFWLPKLSVPAEDPGIPIRRATVAQDRIFGFQVKTVWDLTKVLGQPKQPGTEWNLLGNYMSERGPGVGVSSTYRSTNGLGNYFGNGTIYYQYDSGTDNLGFDRRSLQPKYDHRGEATWRHRQELPGNAMIFGEIGFLSDRNYLEQYDETRFDSDKDVETLLGIRQDTGVWSGLLWARPELNRFEASTEWLPRADLYHFSQPLLDGLAYWSSHSSVGYANLNPMQAPDDPSDPFTPLGLPYMADLSGLVSMTRHEIDAPFQLGPVTVDPYVMGEAAWWEEGFGGDSVDRYLVSAGVRARLFAWKVMPFVNSDIFNLRGLAHKHETLLDYSYTGVSRSINEIPQYNEIDENAQERFRTRYATQIFPGVIPAEFNPRNYAIRNGAGLWTSAPWHELADDQQVLRVSFRNRLQTKAGPPHSERTRDWMIWEAGFSYFPEPERDNFGEDIGLIYNHYRWNLSDRTSLLADSLNDLFTDAQNIWSVGILSQRSTRGSVYVAYRETEIGQYLDSKILTASYSYQMSPKWISTASYAYDLAADEARGTSLTVSRVGLDWILHIGMGLDFSKDNVGVGFSLEPRFGPPSPTNLGYLLGLQR